MIIYLQMLETEEEKSKFEQLYTQYRGLMYRIAEDFLGNEHDAEDAVHQAFLSIIENFEKISEVECPKTKAFCVIVVERKALTMIRDRKKFAGGYEIELDGVEIPMPTDSALSIALAQLSARYREVLLLRFHMGYTTKELAEIFETSHASALKMVWRAKQALAKLLEGEIDHHAEV